MKVRGGNPRIVTDGLVLFYDAQNPYSYPGSGTLVRDISGNGNDGTMTNASVGTATPNIFTFTDTGDYITFTEPLSQATTVQQWTVQTWVKLDYLNGTSDFLVNGWNEDLQFERSTTNRPLNYLAGGDNDSYTYGQDGDFTSGNWTLATFAFDRVNYDPGRVTIQQNLDAESVGTNVQTGDIPTGISGTIWCGDNMDGLLSNLMIYNRKLTASEVTQNYNSQKTRFGL